MSGESDCDGLRATVATACRVLANQKLVTGILGHVSARTGGNTLVVRCRGPRERGLAHSTADEVWTATTGAEPVDLPDGFSLPKEVYIHTEVMYRRPDVGAVVHAHPRSALLWGLAGLEVRPIFGAYNIPAMRLALNGVAVYPRSVLISRRDLATELVDAMAGADVCVMRGHGITVAGATVEQAVVRAVNLDTLLDVAVRLAALGADPPSIGEEDLRDLPDLGSRFNDDLVWRSLAADVEAAG